MTCIAACATQDHASWGACRRAHGIKVGYCRSATNPNHDYTADKRWNAELDLYASARKQGIQPDSTQTRQIRHALDESDRVGKPYGVRDDS
jgi:hypothetical protein